MNLTIAEIAKAINGKIVGNDPCVVPRAVPVMEACLALCLLDKWEHLP